jgi:transcriptional regulator GlxA family with amidase domain
LRRPRVLLAFADRPKPTERKMVVLDLPRQSTAPKGLDHRRLQRVFKFIEAHLEGNITVERLASAACLSRFHFARGFKTATGKSPRQYLSERRLNLAMSLLTQGNRSLIEIAFACRFSSQANFSRAFRRATGLTPGQYRALSGRSLKRSRATRTRPLGRTQELGATSQSARRTSSTL